MENIHVLFHVKILLSFFLFFVFKWLFFCLQLCCKWLDAGILFSYVFVGLLYSISTHVKENCVQF